MEMIAVEAARPGRVGGPSQGGSLKEATGAPRKWEADVNGDEIHLPEVDGLRRETNPCLGLG